MTIMNTIELLDFITLVFTFLCLISSIIETMKMKKKVKLYKIESLDNLSAEEYLKNLYYKINEIYPKTNTRISIKIIEEKNLEYPENSKVVTRISYPNYPETNNTSYTIQKNTDLQSLYINNKEYFWVSNLKEFNSFNQYSNENQDFLKKWNTCIVYPIKEKMENNIIGFLTISSQKEFNNVKGNKFLMKYIENITDKLYEILLKEDKIQK